MCSEVEMTTLTSTSGRRLRGFSSSAARLQLQQQPATDFLRAKMSLKLKNFLLQSLNTHTHTHFTKLQRFYKQAGKNAQQRSWRSYREEEEL